jgi:hypothetical protein
MSMLQNNKQLRVIACAITLAFYLPLANAGILGKMFEKPPKRVELTESSDKAASFKDAFTPEGMFAKTPDKLSSGTKKVIIAGFQLEFSTEQKGVSEGGGAGAGLASTTEKVYSLKNVSDAQFQSVTDKAYAAFVANLQKQGYEVLPPTVLLETGYKEKMANVNKPPLHHERGVASELMFGNLAKIGEDKDEKGQIDNASVIASAKDTSPDVFSKFMAAAGPGYKVADSLQANIVQLRMKVNFAKFDDSGAWVYSQVDDKPQNGIGIKGTGLQVFAPGTKYALYPLAKTIILPNRLADEVTVGTATATQTTERASGGLLKALGGLAKGDITAIAGGAAGAAHSAMASDNFDLTADANYEEIMLKDLNLALNVMTEALPK